MFFSKKKPSASYDPAVQRPALRCSICTGEQVAGFVHPDGHFEDVQLIRTPQELAAFGIPRQSGLVDSLRGEVIFTPEYRSADAVRGLEDFSHIWLVWQFSGAVRDSWSPTVRPPRLGGNTRMGVFATRSPFRPNPLGLSSVKLEGIEMRPEVGPVLLVCGADLMDGTPIYDIKPYIPYADCHPDAAEGFTGQTRRHLLEVSCPEELWAAVPQADRDALRGVLANDPRPSYQHDPARVYGMEFGGLEVHFTVDDPVLTVRDITRR